MGLKAGILSVLCLFLPGCDTHQSEASSDQVLPVPAPAEGQLVPGYRYPNWFEYHGGGYAFVAGPGDPEDFLYRGELKEDGTRDGDQGAIIDKLAKSGANSIYFQVIRSHGGDGDETHNPFIDNDPDKGLNQAVLDQWYGWLSALDRAGVVMYMFIYDDESRIWNTGDRVSAEEREFVGQIVDRFSSLKHLVWVVAEEYSEAYSPARVSRIAREIKLRDSGGHPVAVHKLRGLEFKEFADDPFIDQFAVQARIAAPADANRIMVQAWNDADFRYSNIMSEAAKWGSGEIARRKAWAVAMGGSSVLAYEMDVAGTPIEDLRDMGRLRLFMESTDFQTMAPLAKFSLEDTQYLLISPGRSYIAYADNGPDTFGVAGMAPGSYELHWFSPPDGRSQVIRTKWINGGDHRWDVPEAFGPEVALYVKRLPEPVTPSVPGPAWDFRQPESLGLSKSVLEATAEKWQGAGCVARFGYMAFCWGDAESRKDWASAAKPILSTLLMFAIQEGRLAGPRSMIVDLEWPLRGKDRQITYYDLANMVSGYSRTESPGEAWAYNDYGIALLGRSLERVFGEDVDDVFQRKLGILAFQDDAAMESRKGLGFYSSIRDFARVGLLWARHGTWGSEQILPDALTTRFIRPQVDSEMPSSVAEASDYLGVGTFGGGSSQTSAGPGQYGYAFWFNFPQQKGGPALWPDLPADTFQANGHWGKEMVTMIPSLDMVIATRGPMGGKKKFNPGDRDSPVNRLLFEVVSAVEPIPAEISSAPDN